MESEVGMDTKFDMLLEPAREFLAQLGAFLPRLALSVIVLAGGWLAAKFVRFAVERALRAVNLNVLAERAGMDGLLQQIGIRTDTVGIFGWIGYWLVVLAALIIALNGLGLTYITELVRQLVLFVPHVIVALLVLSFGAYFARRVGDAVTNYCRDSGIQDGAALGRVAQYAIVVFVVLIALDQLSVGGVIVRESFLIILAGVVFGLALAFGLAGQHWAAAMLDRLWPARRDVTPKDARRENEGGERR